jgi:hypothetical protein
MTTQATQYPTETTHRHRDPETKDREHKSTSIPFAIHELDDEDCLIIRLDRKDPARRKIMGAIQAALEQDQRTDEAVRAKAYAQEKLPDDWRRKMPSVTGDPNDPGTRAYRKPAER